MVGIHFEQLGSFSLFANRCAWLGKVNFFRQNASKNNRLGFERRLVGNMKAYDLQVKKIAISIAIASFFSKELVPLLNR